MCRAWWSPWGGGDGGGDAEGSSSSGGAGSSWWREHPVQGDVLLGWLQHKSMAGGERIDLQVEFESSVGGVWGSRHINFKGPFTVRLEPPNSFVLLDDITVLQGSVRSPEVITGTVSQNGEGGGSFELRALPACFRTWWDRGLGHSARLLSPGGGKETEGESDDGEDDDEDTDDDAVSGEELDKAQEAMQMVSGPAALFQLLTGASRGKVQEEEARRKRQSQEKLASIRNFRMTPEDVKAHLDRFVIKQDAAKEALAVAICDHYNRVREEVGADQPAAGPKKQAVVVPAATSSSSHPVLGGRFKGRLPWKRPQGGAKGEEAQNPQRQRQERVRVEPDGRVLTEGGEDMGWRVDTSQPGETVLLSDQSKDPQASLHQHSDKQVVWKMRKSEGDASRREEQMIIWKRVDAGTGDVAKPAGGSAKDAAATAATKEVTRAAATAAVPERGAGPAGKKRSVAGNYMKPNVLLLGPTGSGKTYLMKNLADLVGVPFAKADATKFSETGYVGRNAEDVLADLLAAAGGDAKLAQFGIVYVDEIDKVCAESVSHVESFRRGVQNTFLKLMEETEVTIQSGGMQTLMGGQGTRLSTRYILFVFSGAFSQLNTRLRDKKKAEAAGFGFVTDSNSKVEVSDTELMSFLHEAGTDELVEAGLEPEFVGRIPVRVALGALSEDDLFRILVEAEGGAGTQLSDDFRRYGIRLRLTDGALRAVAKRAVKEKTGARSLITVLENTLRRFKFRLPALVPRGCTELEVTEAVVDDPEAELRRLVALYGGAGHAPAAEAAVVEAEVVPVVVTGVP